MEKWFMWHVNENRCVRRGQINGVCINTDSRLYIYTRSFLYPRCLLLWESCEVICQRDISVFMTNMPFTIGSTGPFWWVQSGKFSIFLEQMYFGKHTCSLTLNTRRCFCLKIEGLCVCVCVYVTVDTMLCLHSYVSINWWRIRKAVSSYILSLDHFIYFFLPGECSTNKCRWISFGKLSDCFLYDPNL